MKSSFHRNFVSVILSSLLVILLPISIHGFTNFLKNFRHRPQAAIVIKNDQLGVGGDASIPKFVGDVSGSLRKKICVVGGGFGGVYTALKISKDVDPDTTDVILIDPKDNFVFLPLLYELAVGTASATEVAPKFSKLLRGSKVRRIKGLVSDLNFETKTCEYTRFDEENTATKEKIIYDQLVLAVGIQPRSDMIPGAADHALSFYRLDDAYKLKNKLHSLKTTKRGYVRITVVGGGFSGVEVAANVVQSLGRDRTIVTIIDRNDKIMQSSAPFNRYAAEK